MTDGIEPGMDVEAVEPGTDEEAVDAEVAGGTPDASAGAGGPRPTAASIALDGAHRVPGTPLTSAREPSLTLARLHLRLGSLSLARAELETLAGRDALDDAGLVDLLEVRWRTGDLTGAGAIATLLLEDGEDGPLLALVVASEAAAARGRPTEARRYATAALAVAGDTIDRVFAGMPRGSVWPADAMALDLPGPTLFDDPHRGAPIRPTRRGTAATTAAAVLPDDGMEVASPGHEVEPGPPEPATIALWAADDLPSAGQESMAAPDTEPIIDGPVLPVAGDALEGGRAALAVGDLASAADLLGLALRFDSTLAPAILDAIDGRTDRVLAFVRGDAYRLLGREGEARQAYADALRAIPTGSASDPPDDPDDPAIDPDPTRQPPEGDPA